MRQGACAENDVKNFLVHFWNRLSGREIAIKSYHLLLRVEAESRISAAMARASATLATRQINPANPDTWEFAGFSQHGEDGILDYLCSQMRQPNRFFVEIGAADGLENCTAWLALARNFGGVMVEGDPKLSARCVEILRAKVHHVHAIHQMVNRDNVVSLMKLCPYRDLDVFSIDIDGIDFYVLKAVLESGFRPKVIVAEYNSAFGAEHAITIPYTPQFSRWNSHHPDLYYGVSIAAWRALMTHFAYRFVTVETSGTNAIFLDPAVFDAAFVAGICGVDFRENVSDQNMATRPYTNPDGDRVLPLRDGKTQFALIQDLDYVDVTTELGL